MSATSTDIRTQIDTPTSPSWRERVHISTAAGLIVFALVFLIFALRAPVFLTANNLIRSILMPASIAAMIAMGMTVVMMGSGIDLSVSAVAGLSALLAATVAARFHIGLPVMFVLAVLGGIAMGAINGSFVAYLGVSPFVVTLSMVFLARGLQFLIALTMVSGTYLMLPRAVTRLGSSPWFLIGTTLVVAVLAWILTERAVYGRFLKASGQNLRVARLSGVPVRSFIRTSYILCGAFAGIGGILLTAQEGMARVGSGESYLVDAFLLPILGQSIFGRFSIAGTLFGAIFMYMIIDGLFILGTSPEYVRIVKGALLLAVILMGGIQKMRSGG